MATDSSVLAWRIPGMGEPVGLLCDAGEAGSIPGPGRSPGVGNDNPLQYSCLENPMDRGAWQATVHEVRESDMTERLTHTFTIARTWKQRKCPSTKEWIKKTWYQF